MSFGSFEQGNNSQPMSEINTTPLVDVMLVLLVIFMITAPLMTQSISVTLPNAEGSPTPATPDVIALQISAEGTLNWNGDTVDEANLKTRLNDIASKNPQPEIHVLADKAVRYEHVARVMADARNAGVSKIGFVMLSE